ncbi:MAG TPA: hypothetical protein VGO11_02270, partial [Chthoniobacteraceae bacterium]|nr:hypothetical protein [Chthoniobacteraceae bacterium]
MKIQLPKLPPQLARFSRRQWMIAGGSLALCLLVAGFTLRSRNSGRGNWKGNDSSSQPILTTVTAGPFLQEVIERGEVQSSSNTEVRCQVPSRGTLGVAIIQIVPEGTYVQPGDALVKLDDSGLQ